MSGLRGRGRKRDDAVHAVRTAKLSHHEGPPEKPWRLRTRDECVANGVHRLGRDDLTGLTYCRWCGFTE